MRSKSALQELFDHVPLAKEEREHRYFLARSIQLRFNVRVATTLLCLAWALCAALTVAAYVGVIRWDQGIVLLGFSFMGIGAVREISRSLARRAFDSGVASMRILTSPEEMSIVDLRRLHPEIDDVLQQWALESDALTVAELNKLNEYHRRARDVG